MPRRPKYTKEELIDTAVAIIREEGEEFLSVRNLVKRLGTAPATIFTHFPSMDALEKALTDKIRAIYDTYVDRGLSKNPPFKGFAIEYVMFSIKEPNLYNYLFLRQKDTKTLRLFISDRGKIRSRRVTGLTPQQQRQVATAVKNAREMALLPFTTR